MSKIEELAKTIYGALLWATEQTPEYMISQEFNQKKAYEEMLDQYGNQCKQEQLTEDITQLYEMIPLIDKTPTPLEARTIGIITIKNCIELLLQKEWTKADKENPKQPGEYRLWDGKQIWTNELKDDGFWKGDNVDYTHWQPIIRA